jgi:hypothetical protein
MNASERKGMWPLSVNTADGGSHYASAYRDLFINMTNKRKLNADVADHNDVLQLLRKGIFEKSAEGVFSLTGS